MKITSLDHFVLTVTDLEAACRFYHEVLGLEILTSAEGRKALKIGNRKINLHPLDSGFEPKAAKPSPGSADFCLLTEEPLASIINDLQRSGLEIELGPVPRQGASGPMLSIYLRDPDGNLLEIAEYLP